MIIDTKLDLFKYGTPKGKQMIRKPVKDGLGNNVRDYIFNPAENRFEHKDELVHESSYDVKPKEPTLGSVEHKHKFPDRYKAGYVDWWNRDKKEKINNEPLVKQFRNDDPSTYLTDEKQQRGMLLSMIEDAKPKVKAKKINAYADIKIPIPTVNYSLLRDPKQEARDAAIEKLRVHAFTKSETDKDKNLGIGSLANTTGRKLRATATKDSWRKNRETIYEK